MRLSTHMGGVAHMRDANVVRSRSLIPFRARGMSSAVIRKIFMTSVPSEGHRRFAAKTPRDAPSPRTP